MAPKLMKFLSVAGTAAMFLVGGGILVHGIPPVAELLHHVETLAHSLPVAAGFAEMLMELLFNGLFGALVGGLLVAVSVGVKRLPPAKDLRT
jgi:predicted DNA repair protein MutK